MINEPVSMKNVKLTPRCGVSERPAARLWSPAIDLQSKNQRRQIEHMPGKTL
jgi:hypothetical protein